MHACLGGAEGIGVKVQLKDGLVVIRGIQKGGGADKTGGRVQAGDVLVEIDGNTAGSSLDQVSARLAGVRGSEVKLRLRRTGVFGFQVDNLSFVSKPCDTWSLSLESSTWSLSLESKSARSGQMCSVSTNHALAVTFRVFRGERVIV